MQAKLLVDSQARLGECVLWCDVRRTLYWIDIEGARLSSWREADGSTRAWTLPDRIGSFALCADADRLLLGLAAGIATFELSTGRTGPVIPVEPEQPATRINDGRCDAQGRFVFGMYNAAERPIGGFYRVGHDMAIERLPLPAVGVANSIAFSPDGSRMWFADSATREIRSVGYRADGRIGEPRLFARLGEDEGFPDGSCVDADGGLWNARWDAGTVARHGGDGRVTATLALPATRPTCPAFGGERLDRLFVSSARIGLSPAALEAQPQAGGVFELDPGCRGLPERRFGSVARA